MILNLLIPSWRLFDRLGTVPKLYVRLVDQSKSGTDEWLALSLNSKIGWSSLFLNPSGNLNHAICNVLERTLQNPSDDKNYRTILNYVKHRLDSKSIDSGVKKFQFKLTALSIHENAVEEQDVLVSEEILL